MMVSNFILGPHSILAHRRHMVFQRSTAFTGTLFQRLSFFACSGSSWRWRPFHCGSDGYLLAYTPPALDTIIACCWPPDFVRGEAAEDGRWTGRKAGDSV
jgi:hypothetical protein